MQSEYEDFNVLSAPMSQSFAWPQGGTANVNDDCLCLAVFLGQLSR